MAAYKATELNTALQKNGATKAQAYILTAIAGAESSYGANPYGDKGLGAPGYTSFGPWQIHTPAHPQYNQKELVSNLEYSAKAAVEVFKSQGYGAWTTYKTGAYKPYLVGGPVGKGTNLPGEEQNVTPVENVKKGVEGSAEALKAVGEVLGHFVNWIEEPLTPIKFAGGAVLLYIGIRTLTGGTGAARESSRAVRHARELAL